MKFFKYLGFLLVQIIITFIVVFFVVAFIENYVETSINSSGAHMDTISLANTFMVFVTFILVGVTLVITLASIWFAKKVSQEKIAIIKENTKEIVNSIVEDSDLKKHLISSITNNNSFKKEMNAFLTEFTSYQNEDMKRIFMQYQNELKEQMEELIKSSNTTEREQKDVSKINNIMEQIYSSPISETLRTNKLNKTVEKLKDRFNKWSNK